MLLILCGTSDRMQMITGHLVACPGLGTIFVAPLCSSLSKPQRFNERLHSLEWVRSKAVISKCNYKYRYVFRLKNVQ